jgi:predicted metal-dependent phosphoesterase TrpH
LSSLGPPTFDLQSHSRHSDGVLGPTEVVNAAAEAGVELLALSDHDTVDGVAEALQAAEALPLRVVPAVEISAIDPTDADLHILGYLVDHGDPTLLVRLRSFRGQREARAGAMSERLQELGFVLDEERLAERERQGKSVGRPHLAEAVTAHPDNRERLEHERRTDVSSFIEGYLIEGRPGFVPRQGPSVAEAIAVIHAAGGLAVWAHPFWNLGDPDNVLATIDRFHAYGVDGVEAFYVTHDRAQTELVADRCQALGLLSTGSADFHGPDHPHFSSFRAFSTYGRRPVLGPIGEVRP